jgi:hypothetical protein
MQATERKALDTVLKLVQSPPPDSHLRSVTLEYHHGQWECTFTNWLDRTYTGRDKQLDVAICKAIDVWHGCLEVNRNHESIKAAHMATLNK